MKIAAKPSAFIAVVTACAFLFQFGACSYESKPQSIPVTSNPVGARIIADGQDAGTTPLTLSLKRNADHKVRIEKPGYNPVDILLVSKGSGVTPAAHYAGGLVLVTIFGLMGGLTWEVADNSDSGFENFKKGLLVGALAGAVLVLASAKRTTESKLNPSVINVTLEKTQAQAQARTNVVILDRDQLKDIRWIRISCAEGGAEEIVAVN